MSMTLTTPDGFACSKCGYDMANSANWICCECGSAYTFEDGEAFHARRECVPRFRQLVTRQLAWIAIALVLTMGVVVFSVGDLFSALVAGVGCGIISLGSTLIGLCIAWRSQRSERAAWAVAWLESHVWLHLPWFLPIAMAAVLKPASIPVAGMFGDVAVHSVRNWAIPIGAVVWLIAVAVAMGLWRGRYKEARQRYMLTDRMAITYFRPLVLLVFVASMWCGAFAGIAVFHVMLIPPQQ